MQWQRAVYDERYLGTGYDDRSAVRVLTAESSALHQAVRRASEMLPPGAPLTLFDFGSGTGRVTNEFVARFAVDCADMRRDLHVVAYDVAANGLRKAARNLIHDEGFTVVDKLSWDNDAPGGYRVGTVARPAVGEGPAAGVAGGPARGGGPAVGGPAVSVTFVHGAEGDAAPDVGLLVRAANEGRPFGVTTSWYSAVSHIPTAARRAEFLRMLCDVTDPRGEVLVAPSVSGDLVELQAEWAGRLAAGTVGAHPIEQPGDVIYETELGQQNFYHVFGSDLADLLEECRRPGQRAWLEAVRMPDEEFTCVAEEQDNYRRAREFNARIGRRRWRPEDFRQVHTALAVLSGHPGE
ncbi:hypothetical protein [Actinoplanes sp. NBRC 101535]|nr:hypothetical protein [Actinoplanes sp. NBRC 101535]